MSVEVDIARLSGVLAHEYGADHAIQCLTNISRALQPMRDPFVIDRIAQEVAHRHGFTLAELRGSRGSPQRCHARQEAYARCYALRGDSTNDPFSLEAIGRWFGNRDHSTVWHGIRAHEARQARGVE